MRQCGTLGIRLATLFVAVTFGTAASADTLDLTSTGASGFVGGAFFQQTSPQPTGTGVIDPFLRLQNNGFEQGYNTSGRPVQFDEKTDPNFTRNLLLSSVPVVNINGINYRQFLLDINEQNTPSGRLLSMDSLQLFQSNTGSLTSYPNLGTKIYDLDANGNNMVLLDYSLNHGSGSGDMFAYIPDSLFDPNQQYVYLYSAFGNTVGADGDADAGFEEWAVLKGSTPPPVNEVPGPATLLFAALGCGLGLLGYTRGRGKNPVPVQAV